MIMTDLLCCLAGKKKKPTINRFSSNGKKNNKKQTKNKVGNVNLLYSTGWSAHCSVMT